MTSYLIRTWTQAMDLWPRTIRVYHEFPSMERTPLTRVRANLLKSPKFDNSVTLTTPLTFDPVILTFLPLDSQYNSDSGFPCGQSLPSPMELVYADQIPRDPKLKIAPLRGDQQSCPPVVNGGRQIRRIDSTCNSSTTTQKKDPFSYHRHQKPPPMHGVHPCSPTAAPPSNQE